MQFLSPTTSRQDRDNLSFFYDTRSGSLDQIEDFLDSSSVWKLQQSIRERSYIVLGGDGLFVSVAKMAHRDGVSLLGINFWTKGFLLHERDILRQDTMSFIKQEYPILHADVKIGDEHIHGHAFNEVYLTRAGDASSISLSLSHRGKTLEHYQWDGLMISTPAGSTGWSRSYGAPVLPHDANLNILTPIGWFSPRGFAPVLLPDKGRIRIKNDTTRENPLDILVDNRRIVSMESRPIELTIERASRGVELLIESGYREIWWNKVYREQGFNDEVIFAKV
jgi:NAD+ kinase